MAFLSEIQSQEVPGPNRDVEPDLGAWQGFRGAWNMGKREALVPITGNLVQRAYLGTRDRMQGMEPLEPEAFAAEFGDPKETGFEFKADETRSQAKMRFKDHIEGIVQQKRASNIGIAGGLTAGLLGNTLFDAPLMFIPYAKMAHSAKAGAKVLQGQKISAAEKTVDALSSNPISAKVVQGALAGEKTPLKAGETFFQLAKYGAVEQTIENTAVYFGSQALGRDYGMLDFAGDTVFGAGILGILGGFQTRRLMKIGNMMARDITNAKALSILAEGGDVHAVAKHLNNYSEDVTGTFMDSVDKSPRIQAIMGMSKEKFYADPDAPRLLREFFSRNRAGIFFTTMKANIPFDTRLSVVDAKRQQHAQMARITEALPDFLAGKDMTGRLSADDLEVLRITDAKLQNLMETVGGLEPEARVEVPPRVAKAEARFQAAEEALNNTKREIEALRSEGKEIPEELNTRFEQELDEFDRSGEELRDLEFDGTMDALDQGSSKATVDISGSTRKSPFFQKDVNKFQGATKLISRGSPRSSSAAYAEAAGDLANSGKYESDDIVGVSVEGNRGGRVGPDFKEIDKAIEAKANFQIDKPADRNRGYNVGEREVAAYLKKKGYEEPNGDGLFVPAGRAVPTKPSAKAPEPVFTKADSNKVIDAADRFMQALGFDVRVRAKRKKGSMAHYDSDTGDINLDPDVRPDRALQLTFHELVHHFRETNKNVYDALAAVVDRFRGDQVFMDKILTPDLRKKYQEKFKKDPMRADQKMSEEETAWFMTEATKHPEFWQALKQRDPKVFEQFKLWLRRLWDMINGNRRIDRKNMTADQKLAMRQFGEILAAAESVDSGSRSRGQGTMDALDPDPKPRKPIEQATSELDANLEAEAAKGREATEAKNKEAAKGVEERAKKVSQDPLQTAKERVEAQIEGDLATIILDTKTDPETLLEKLKEVAETLGAEGNPVRSRYVALVERIIGFKKQTRQNYEHGRDVLQRGTKPDLSTTGEEGFIRLAQLRKRMETEKLGDQEALREYARWLDEDQMKRALAEINNDKVLHHNDSGLRRMKTSKGKLKYLKSFTDGIYRRGVRLFGGSIQSDVNAQVTKDMSKLRSVFAKHGFLDELDNTIHRIDGESDIPVTERAKARREASNMFVWDLAQYYKTGEVPSRYGDREADFKELGEALRETLHSQITQLNEYGAGIRFRDDHLGLNYRWSDEVIRKMGFDEFRARMIDEADWDKIEESHGGMMVASRNDKGYADEMVAFEKEAFIRQWFDEAVSPVKPQDHPSTNIARSFGKARMIHMKPEYEMQSLIDFSGHGSLGRLLQDQIRHRSEMIAIMRNLGNEPLANFDKIVRAAGIDPNVNTTRVKSGSKLDRALVASGAAERTHKMDVNHMYKTVEFLTGALDNPASHDLSFWGKSYRQLSNMAFMWTAGVSAITDVPITLLTLEQMGADVSIPQLMGAMKRSATRRFIDKDRGELTAFFEGSGAAFDAMKNAGARRLALAESNGDTFLAKGSEMMFTINGVSGWTSMMQEAFVDVLTQSLARQARSGSWDPHMKMTMRSMGFTQDDFIRLADGVVEINGVDRVGPPSFEGQDLHMKLLQFFSEYRDKAVIVPDASTQSLIRFGTQAGTWQGEAVRSVMQYASFPVAMNRVVNRMLLLNAEGRNPWTTGQIGMTRTVVFAGGMMGLAYAAMVMKDLARLRGPAMPWEMNQAVLGRLIDQAGFLGVIGNLAGAAKDGRVSSVIAPNIGTQANMLGKLSSDGFGAALYASRAYTGDSIPIIGPWITTTLAYGFQGGYAEAMRIGANFRERELNVDQLTPVPKP